MTRLERLQNSCARLPKLVESHAPTSLLVAELHILADVALEAVRDSVHRDFDERLELHRSSGHRKNDNAES